MPRVAAGITPGAHTPLSPPLPPPPRPLQIGLVPEAEFLAHPLAAEQGLADPEAGAHQRMLNRLAHEVAFRYRALCGWWVGGGWGRLLVMKMGQLIPADHAH